MLHDSSKPVDAGRSQEEDHGAEQGIAQRNLTSLLGREARQTSKVTAGSQGARGTTDIPCTLVPAGDRPRLTRRPPKHHNHPALPGKIQPLGNRSLAGKVPSDRVNGHIQAESPRWERGTGEEAVKPVLKVPGAALP